MTRAQAGKLGYAASKEQREARDSERKEAYAAAPNHCKRCGKVLDYARRANTFCNRSCRTAFTNIGVRRHGYAHTACIVCGRPTTAHGRKFCSVACSQQYVRDDSDRRLTAGTLESEGARRRALRRLYGARCMICGITEWQGQEVPLVMDHIDGNSGNNIISNLRLVCGNCDMQLPTYKGRNKGNGRATRRARYAEGKSY